MISALVVLALLAGAIYALTMPGGVIALLFVVAVLYLAYRRMNLLSFTLTFTVLLAAYTFVGAPAGVWKGFLWVLLGTLWALNFRPLRKALISRPFLRTYRKLLPAMSQTETPTRARASPSPVISERPDSARARSSLCAR